MAQWRGGGSKFHDVIYVSFLNSFDMSSQFVGLDMRKKRSIEVPRLFLEDNPTRIVIANPSRVIARGK